MKKLAKLLCGLFVCMSICSCSLVEEIYNNAVNNINQANKEDYLNKIDKAYEDLKVLFTNRNLSSNIDFPTSIDNVDISYSSSNKEVLSDSGVVNCGSEDSKVVLTVKLSYKGVVVTKFLSFVVLAKKTTDDNYNGGTIAIGFINDFHGAVEYESISNPGIAKVATRLKEIETKYGENNTILLSGGDNYQGTLLSNQSHGKIVVECFNKMGIDGSTVGNHEFDWGIDYIKNYYDGKTDNGEADFKIGAANIYYKNGNKVDWLNDYWVFEKDQIKIGVIPVIGYGLESSILASKVSEYTFKDPVPIIKDLSYKLRTSLGCNAVVVDAHDGGDDLNSAVAKFDSNHRVDAIINAHTHDTYTNYLTQSSGGQDLVCCQAGSGGADIGCLEFTFNLNKKIIKATGSATATGTSVSDNLECKQIINSYLIQYGDIKNEVIGTAATSITSKSQYYSWSGQLLLEATNSDLGILNTGAFRTLTRYSKGANITYGQIYSLNPFDNHIIVTNVKGSLLQTWINRYGDGSVVEYALGLDEDLDYNSTYRVAIIDYVANKSYSQSTFINQSSITTDLYMRDIMVDDIKAQQSFYNSFAPETSRIRISSEMY